jgi:ABC-type sugar transport system ATPase subunit
MRGLSKAFAGIHALQGVDLTVRAGEIHGLLGENGAGKSTLMRLLSGVMPPDSGEIIWRGQPVRFASPLAAQAAGIAMIHQELSLVPCTSITDNLWLGQELHRPLGFLRLAEARRRAQALMDDLGAAVDVSRPVEEYPLSVQQMVEVAKALSHEPALLIMDEPTSALTEPEVERLFATIRSLRDRGVAIVYISHKLDEIEALCDRVTVLRDGRLVTEVAVADTTPTELVRLIVGRELGELFPKHQTAPGEELLRVENLVLAAPDRTQRRLVDEVSLTVRAGEIVGLAGLLGSGASELLGSLFGRWGRPTGGRVWLQGREVHTANPTAALASGLALLTNDRKATGLVPPLSVLHNLTLASLAQDATAGFVSRRRELSRARPVAAGLNLRAPSLDAEVNALSGGNQQKVALAKWLLTEPRIMLLDEPTRGVDVGAKAEIYELMNRWAAEGRGLLLITSELPELLALSDRILVMSRGRITAEFSREQATSERVMAAAMEVDTDG